MLLKLTGFWAEQGCVVLTPYHTEVGAGTSNPATFLRVLGPEPWSTVYVEPSIRPADGRYGENPNRLQHFFQMQVILKPAPENIQELFLQSLEAIGLDLKKHDVRFVEDNWQSPSLGAWGVGWEAWLDGMEVLQFTYFQECGGQKLWPKACELTYGIERIATYIQNKDSVYDLEWAPGVTYRDVYHQNEVQYCHFNFEEADVDYLFSTFHKGEEEAQRLLDKGLLFPAYDYCLKMSHAFNLLDARGSFSATERGRYLLRNRAVAQRCAQVYVEQREEMGHPMMRPFRKEASSSNLVDVPSVQSALTSPEDFLLEIGVEELPHSHQAVALETFPDAFEKGLKKAGIDFKSVKGLVSPRRLALIVEELAPAQLDKDIEVRGPKAQSLKDGDGNWTMAAIKFAESRNAKPEDFEVRMQGKAEYAFLKSTVKGRTLDKVINEIVLNALKAIPFPKSMTWDENTFVFSRPIRWITAIHGTTPVQVTITLRQAEENCGEGNLTSGTVSYGHRRLAQGEFEIPSVSEYERLLREHQVLVNHAERRTQLVSQLHTCAGDMGLIFKEEEEQDLIDEVCDLVEWPCALVGSIPEEALALPEEIITTPMRQHQRYFPLRNGDGSLSSKFAVVANGAYDADDEAVSLIVAGNERVLNARLRDASFFWEADTQKTLAEHAKGLDKIVFHKKLGTVAEKVERLVALADKVGSDLGDVSIEDLKLVLTLMKADLPTNMVVEFTSLEGLVASLYGKHEGLSEKIYTALFEQRLPRRSDDKLPTDILGASAGLLDRIDSLTGYMGIGLSPTGSRDPLGMRRLAIGLLAVLNEFSLEISLDKWIRAAAEGYGDILTTGKDELVANLGEFIGERLSLQARDEGKPFDLVQAAIASHRSSPATFQRCLEALIQTDDVVVQDLAEHTKRMVKISKTPADTIDEGLMDEPSEKALYACICSGRDSIEKALSSSDFAGAIEVCSTFVEPVKIFFDSVMVNDERDDVKCNRHALLKETAHILKLVADFSLIEKKSS